MTTDIKELKRTALHCRQDLDNVVDLYGGLQNYVDHLTSTLRGESAEQPFDQGRSAYELQLRDEENLFLEWHDGEQLLNEAVFSLVADPEGYVGRLDLFEADLRRATAKFQHLIEERKRRLRQIHEEIALELSELEAVTITHLEPTKKPTSLADQAERADKVMDSFWKWGGRIIKFLPWVTEVLTRLK